MSLQLLAAVFGAVVAAAYSQNVRQLVRPARDEPARIALVIGNGAYRHAATLPNPVNDARAMTRALQSLGFEVIGGERKGLDLTHEAMDALISEFGARLAATKGVGLFYYAGHGVQSGGHNYLIPVDAEIPDESRIKYKAVSLGYVLDEMAAARNDFNLVILDACRNNPFARSWRSSRDAGDNKGLGTSNPPRGTLVLYATEPGSVSSDGIGENSPFTTAFLRQINTPNLELDPLIKAVARDVQIATKQKQSPWKEGLYSGDFYFKTGSAPKQDMPLAPGRADAEPSIVAKDAAAQEREAWDLVKNSSEIADFRGFLKEFPGGSNAAKAKIRLDELAWAVAKAANTKDKVQAYLSEFPDGANAPVARILLRQLDARSATPVNESGKPGATGTQFDRFRTLVVKEQDDTLVAETTAEIKRDPTNYIAYWMRTAAYDPLQESGRNQADARAVVRLVPAPKTALEFAALCSVQRFLPIAERSSMDYCSKAIEIDPGVAHIYNTRANSYQWDDYARKIIDYTKAIELEPKVAHYYSNRAFAYWGGGDKEAAMKDFLKAVEVDPSIPDNHINLGWEYWRRKDFENALRMFDKAVELAPTSAEPYLQRAWYFHERNETLREDMDFYKALQVEPGKSGWAYSLRANWSSNGEKPNLDKALDDIKKAMEFRPDRQLLFYRRGQIYSRRKEYQAAISDYSKALQWSPTNYLYIGRAKAYADSGNMSAAINDLDEALKLDPKDARVFYERGVVYATNKKHDQAIAELTRAIEMSPRYTSAYFYRGYVYILKEQWDLVIADSSKAIELGSVNAAAYNNRGVGYYRTKQYALAIADYSKAIELAPNTALYYRNRANSYEASDEKERAKADRQKADEIEKQKK